MDGRRKIEKKDRRDLKRLLKKLQESRVKASVFRQKCFIKLKEAEFSENELLKLQRKVRYWLGKEKAGGCPAWKRTNVGTGLCRVRMDYSSSMQFVFLNYCSYCKLTKEEALKGGVFRNVFQNTV